ncbi:hypothetical protein [Micromonospora chalcea]|uniref:hypothetical protein n=1 Tax=Micromonospora chalcea TaxID=1874 RepID=UPI003D76090F
MEPAARRTTWDDVREFVGDETEVLDEHEQAWKRFWPAKKDTLYRVTDGHHVAYWTPQPGDVAILPTPPIPEPPDFTIIEFEHHTDLYAAWRNSSPAASGGEDPDGKHWVLYGETVGRSWAEMYAMFGDSLALAVRLLRHPDDLIKQQQWPTEVYARKRALKEAGDGEG